MANTHALQTGSVASPPYPQDFYGILNEPYLEHEILAEEKDHHESVATRQPHQQYELDSSVDWQLRLEDARHIRERKQILERYGTSQNSPLLEQAGDLYGHFDSSMWLDTDLPNLDCDSFCGSSMVPMILDESSNNILLARDNDSLHGFADTSLSASPDSQIVSSPPLFNGSTYEDTPSSIWATNNLYNGLGYYNESLMEPMVDSVPTESLLVLDARALQSEVVDQHTPPQPQGSTCRSAISPRISLREFIEPPFMPLNNINMTSHTVPDRDVAAHNVAWTSRTPIPVEEQVSIFSLDATNLQPPPSPIESSRGKRARCSTLSSERQSDSGSVGQSASQLEICMYTDPITERERKRYKGQKKTRKVNGKVQRACFGCRFYNRKVRMLDQHIALCLTLILLLVRCTERWAMQRM
jgi:hypothetical protein